MAKREKVYCVCASVHVCVSLCMCMFLYCVYAHRTHVRPYVHVHMCVFMQCANQSHLLYAAGDVKKAGASCRAGKEAVDQQRDGRSA